jgi:YesN/AraC family two-component response regulator
MQISNDDLARILGRLEAKLDEQASTSKRVEEAVASVDRKVTRRLDEHDERIRKLEVTNPEKLSQTVSDHSKRIEALEKGAARAGVIAGLGSGVAMSVLIALAREKLGL